MDEDMDRGSDGGARGSDGGDRGSDGGERGSDGGAHGSDGEDRGSDGGNRGSDGEDRGSVGGDRGSDGQDGGSDGGYRGSDEGESGGDGKRTWQLFIKGLAGRTTTVKIDRDSTVDIIFDIIAEKDGVPPHSQRILYTTKQLEYGQGKRLSDYNIQDESTLFLVLRLRGGSRADDDSSSLRKTLPEDVEATDEPDMISGEDDPNTPRARMSCGHAITPETLTTYCESLLSAGKYIFQCPYISERTGEHCGEEWSYIDVRRLAHLNQDERKKFEEEISRNYLRRGRGIQECPKCASYCERISNIYRRVVCPLCSARDGKEYPFCWYCLHEWVGRGTDYCGNDDCSGEDKRLKILRECKKKTIVDVRGCPAIRACLECGMLIEHDRACKHMTCICGEKFCFICLKPAVFGNYQCGTFNSRCQVAPVQRRIPGDS